MHWLGGGSRKVIKIPAESTVDKKLLGLTRWGCARIQPRGPVPSSAPPRAHSQRFGSGFKYAGLPVPRRHGDGRIRQARLPCNAR
jgi:hypothetical protein